MKSEKRKMSFSIAVLLTLIMVLGGCGSIMLDAKTPISAEPEKALVIFVRSTAIFAGERTRLWDGDKFIGELMGKQKLEYLTEPGKHVFVATNKTGGSGFLDAELGAGKRYVVKAHVYPAGFSKAGVSLDPVIPGEKADVTIKEVNAMVDGCSPKIIDPAKGDAFATSVRSDLDAAVALKNSGKAKVLTLAEKDSW